MLSRIAQELADEIRAHDWSDAHSRLDRAGHQRSTDTRAAGTAQLSDDETDWVRTNVMWVVAQVLKYEDPNLDLHEFALACGVPRRLVVNVDGQPSGVITAGIRFNADGTAMKPGPME